MNKRSLPLYAGAFLLAMAPTVFSQTYTAQAQLERAATGDAFSIGDTQFRLVPSATIRKADAGTSNDAVTASGYVIEPSTAAAPGQATVRSQSSVGTAPSDSPGEELAAAVSPDGQAIVIRPRINVYFAPGTDVQALADSTGGTLVYASQVGGKATLGYASVAEAMAARQQLLGRAGVKQAAPDLVPPENQPL